MRKVLLLGDFRSPHMELWIESYKTYGYDVYGFTLEDCTSLKLKDCYHIRLNAGKFRYALASGKLRNFLDKLKPDIVHANMVPNYGLLAYLSCKDYVLSSWGRDILSISYKPFRAWITKRILKKASCIHTDAGIVRWIIANRFGIPYSRIMDFPFGLPKDLLEKPLRELDFSKFILVEYRKHEDNIYNQSKLLEALRILVHEFNITNFKLYMLSYGKDTYKFKQLTKLYSIENFVEFSGRTGDQPYPTEKERIFAYLSKAHIYVSTTLVDSTSVSLLEAMALGAVPVVSDLCANREWIVDGINGMLYDPLEPYEIANALRKAMDRAFLTRAREMNKRIVMEKADWESNFASFMEFLSKRKYVKRKHARGKFPWSYV